MGIQIEGRSNSGSKRRLLHSSPTENMGCFAEFSTGTIRHISTLFMLYGGILLGIVITMTFYNEVPFEANPFYVGMISIAAGLLLTSQVGVTTSSKVRGPLICFFLLTLLLICAEIAVVTVWVLKLIENQPDYDPSTVHPEYAPRYVFRIILPLLNENTVNYLKLYESEDSYQTTYMYALAGFGCLLIFLQILATILALCAICSIKKKNYDGQSTLQRSSSVYYERGSMWPPHEPVMNHNVNWTD